MPSAMRGRHTVLALHKALQFLCNQPDNYYSASSQRCITSDASSKKVPELKLQLRELYKRVHPDLFHDHPLAREANEHSFKLLQVILDRVIAAVLRLAAIFVTGACLACKPVMMQCKQAYLDSAKKGGEVGRTAGVPYNFLFYLHKEYVPPQAAEERGEATIADDADGAHTAWNCLTQQRCYKCPVNCPALDVNCSVLTPHPYLSMSLWHMLVRTSWVHTVVPESTCACNP